MELIVSTVQTSGVDDPSLQKQQQQEEEPSKTVTKSANKRGVVWPEFKVPLPDPVLGEIFCGKGSLSPEQTLVEFISTSAAFHEVKKQPLRSLEWDLLKVFPFNVMPANAAAWYMAKRKFYMNQSFDQQLLPFLLKKYPEKFKVLGSSVVFLEVYKKDVAKAKLKYLVQYGLNAYFSHKADEYGVYFFDPFYYENTEPFHESLRQCITKPDINNKSKLVFNYFSSTGLREQFKFQQHSAYLVSISKQPGIKIVTSKTGVIISMINNQYGFIKFGDSGETALFCCKSLYKDGWQFSGDPLKLPAMKFDGYKIPGGGQEGDQVYSWYAVLVWCGRRPSPKFCSTAEDLNSTPVFREGRLQRLSAGGDNKKMRQPSSSMMVGQVTEVRRNGAVLQVREDSQDKVFVPGWQRQLANNPGKWLSTVSGECIGLGDLVAYYVDTQETKPDFSAVGKNVMVLKECEDEGKGRRRRRQSTERSAGARYEVGETSEEEEKPTKKKGKGKKERNLVDTSDESDTEEDVTDGELEWLEKDLETIMDKEDPKTKTLKLLKDVHNQLNMTRDDSKKKSPTPKKSSGGIKNLKGGYTAMRTSNEDFWRMKRLLAAMEAGYHSESDPDYQPGDEVEVVTRPRTGSETQADTSFTGSTAASSILNRSQRSRRSSMATSVSTTKAGAEKNNLPYWVKAISKAEKFDPELGKFVADDKYYKEEKDPDYVLPKSDIEVDTDDDEEDPEELNQLSKEAEDNLPEDIMEGKYKEKKVSSPVKVTLTPSKEEGQAEPTEEILTLETDEEEEGEKTGGEEKVVQPQLWEKCLLMTEQPDEYDSGDDPEYVPPPVILDTSFEYDEFVEEEEIISDNEVEMLKTEAAKDLQTPTCYLPIWVAVDSPSERIQKAKELFAGLASTEVIQVEDTSGKDTDSNGKKEADAGPDATSPAASKAPRERKKSKSRSGDEKSSDDGEKTEAKIPKTPPKAEGIGGNRSPKKSPEKITKSPKKSVGDETAEIEKIPEN